MSTTSTTIAPRLAHTILAGASERKRRVYDICQLDQPDARGIAYHGFVNCTYDGHEPRLGKPGLAAK